DHPQQSGRPAKPSPETPVHPPPRRPDGTGPVHDRPLPACVPRPGGEPGGDRGAGPADPGGDHRWLCDRPARGGPVQRQVRPQDAPHPGHGAAHRGVLGGRPVRGHHRPRHFPGPHGRRGCRRRCGGHGHGPGSVLRLRDGQDVFPHVLGQRPGADPGTRDRLATAPGDAVARDLRIPCRLRHPGDHRLAVPGARDSSAGKPPAGRHDCPPALPDPFRRPRLCWAAAGGRPELRGAVHVSFGLAVPVPGHLWLLAPAVRPALWHQFTGHRGRNPNEFPPHPAGAAAVDPRRCHRLDVRDGHADRGVRPAGVWPLGSHGSAVVLHHGDGLYVPLRAGARPGRPCCPGGHCCLPAGVLNLHDGRPHLPRGWLAGHHQCRSHGCGAGGVHPAGHRGAMAGGAAAHRSIDPL
ncbi:Multidrug resistance transporter, Bcr/CflA family, partial [Arthrobacter sp. DR-2P]